VLHNFSQHIRILGLAAGIAGAVALAGCGGGEDPNAQPAGGSGGSGGAAPMPNMGGGGGQMGGGQVPSTGTTGAPGGAAVASAPKNDIPPSNARLDPFKPWWSTEVPPPPVLSYLTPARIAVNSNEPPPDIPVEIQEVPDRRVAGILTGNGVYALIEGVGDPKVVKPGDVLDDGYRVVRISSTAVTLQKKVGFRTYTQVVPLTDAGSSQTTFGGGRPGGMGGPGGPGMFPGGGGSIPGFPGGRGRGGGGSSGPPLGGGGAE
jgi:hypothetical protein